MAEMRALFVLATAAAVTTTACRTPRRSPVPGKAPVASMGSADPVRELAPVRITFTAKDPHSLCRVEDCSGAPPITIRSLHGEQPLVLSPGRNATLCASCAAPATGPHCSPMGVGVERVEIDWDGTHYGLSSCGAGTPCAARRIAEPGRYVAELCALKSTRTIDSIGAPTCVDTGQRVCLRVEFDLPGPPVQADL